MRQAVNFAIQGTAADINKLALSRLYEALPPDCRLLFTHHDSVLVDAPLEKAKTIGRIVQAALEISPPEFSVPLFVKTRASQSWGGKRNLLRT